MDYYNYIEFSDWNFRWKCFAYVDTSNYLADNILGKNGVRVKFQNEAYKTDSPFILVICKVRKADLAKFYASMEELKDKMLIMGHPDYEDFCKRFTGLLKEAGLLAM